ncbi:hypothetical protein GCK72_020771 [Caenorhabditis remanei]|uniref:Uncharacterized protein n=1 Tax=Caenorhabditis remanei TaxID=31234 RepID=A0A6A5GHY6_CAERE|nr:hypothetical protein GCK72_020771 [Caenorhabditis remanei]KAF1754211.1 hypothetical protein GCK72_020771 [Caenorhabditis remanei]
MPTLSVENLKETLKLFNLDKCFGDISKYAERCIQSQKQENPGSTNMPIAITRCQFNAIARKLPKILKFIHAQGACSRMFITGCELCDGRLLDVVSEESDESEEELKEEITEISEEEKVEESQKTSLIR